MEAGSPGGGLLRWLGRILCCAGCGVGLAFVLALLAPGSETAHAADAPAGGEPSAGPTAARAVEATADADALWADPGALSTAATRRATPDTAPSIGSAPRRTVPTSLPASRSPEAVVTATAVTTGFGSLSAGGTPDAGPSIAQLAVLAAALLAVRWLSQRLPASSRHGAARSSSAASNVLGSHAPS